jgi:hypothetical protein
MSSFLQTVRSPDDGSATTPVVRNPWGLALGALAGVLLLAGLITVVVGVSALGNFDGVRLGVLPAFDEAAAVTVVGAAAIVLGIVVGACWLVVGAVHWDRRG